MSPAWADQEVKLLGYRVCLPRSAGNTGATKGPCAQAISRGCPRHLNRTRQCTDVENYGACSVAFGVRLQYLEVGAPGEIETAFRCATKARSDAALALTSPITFAHRSQVVTLAIKSRLPGDLLLSGICGRRRDHDVQHELQRFISSRRVLCRQDPKGNKAGSPAGGAAHQV